jgi:adenylyl-sulfate kinase
MDRGFTLWFTGLSGSGKSTLAGHVARALRHRGLKVEILDGDEVRTNLSQGLGFSKEDRDTNIKRIGYVCKLLTRNGVVAISAAISPYREARDYNRQQIGRFVEVYVQCSIEEMTHRDVKGLYKKALAGEVKNFTGISDPYEPPAHPEITVDTEHQSEEDSLRTILGHLERTGWIPAVEATTTTSHKKASTTTLTPQEVECLNARFAQVHPTEIIRWAMETFRPDVAMTSSFGAESAGLIHMAIQVDPQISVRFVDTGLHFPETLQFMEGLTRRFRLNAAIFRTRMDVEQFKRDHAHLPIEHPDYCCGEYKVEAMQRALAGLRCWITGIRRSQAPTRANTPFVEVLEGGLTKVAPLAAWTSQELHAYMAQHNLPYHPLWHQGYTSIGCYPCTQQPVDLNNPRSGRWAGQDQTECGIHDIGKPPRPSSS